MEVPTHLQRVGASFGFTLRGERWPFFIESVVQGGAAHQAKVESGDMLLRINESSLVGLTLHEAVKLVKNSGASLDLFLKREGSTDKYNGDAIVTSSSAPATIPGALERQRSHELQLQQELPSSAPKAPATPGAIPRPKSVVHATVNDHAILSRVGHRHGTLNQDTAMCEILMKEDGTQAGCVVGVFDGHGLLGEQAATVAAARLAEISRAPSFEPQKFIATPQEAMRGLFDMLQAAVLAEHDNPPASYEYPGCSSTLKFTLREHNTFGQAYQPTESYMPPAPIDFGCTAVVAVLYNSFLCVGNAGDAGCIVCVPGDPDAPARMVTERHNAQERVEADRIERDFAGKAVITPDGYLSPLDPDLAQYEVQTTRCLGHRLLRAAGITSEPAVVLVPLREAKAIVLCSDGVSDELQPRDIADRVVDVAAADGAEALCRDAQEFCMDQDKVDDCTAVVLKLTHACALRGVGEDSDAI